MATSAARPATRPAFLERRADAIGNTFLPDALPAEAAKRSHSIGRCSFRQGDALHDSSGGEAPGRPALRTCRSGRLSKEAASYVPLAQEQKTVLALFDALSLTQPHVDDQSTSASSASGSARSNTPCGLDQSERSCSPCGGQVLDTDLRHQQLAMEGESVAMDGDCTAPMMGYILQPVQPEMDDGAFAGKYVEYGDYAEYSFPYEHAHFSDAPQFSEVAHFGDSAQFGDSVQFGDVVPFSEPTQFSDHVQFSDVAQFCEHAQFSESSVAPWCWTEDGDWSGQGFGEGDWSMHGF